MAKWTEFRHELFEAGQKFSDFEAHHLWFQDCFTNDTPLDDSRITIEDATITSLRLTHSRAAGLILRNVTIDGIRADGFSGFYEANQYEHVTIKGAIGNAVFTQERLILAPDPNDKQVLENADRGEDWSLDISEAEGNIEIRGYRADRIRRNTETQAIVRRGNALDQQWREIEGMDHSVFRIALEGFSKYDYADQILVANPRSKKFASDLEVIQRLRDAGIADPD